MIAPAPNPVACAAHRRILIVDDNPSIHKDFRKVLNPDSGAVPGLEATEAAFFGDIRTSTRAAGSYQIDSANQGEEALAMIQKALSESLPYSMAFVDVRMPPGWDGIETVERIWKVYPELQVVICTAYSDYSFDDMIARLGETDRLVLLKKPFDSGEVLQLAHMMTEKWRLHRQARAMLVDLENKIARRAADLREPINGIGGMSELLLQTDLSSEQRELAATIRQRSRDLLVILNSILKLSKA